MLSDQIINDFEVGLNPHESCILLSILSGAKLMDIAKQTGLKVRTIKFYLKRICKMLNCNSINQVVMNLANCETESSMNS